jgi:hypothetical protein
MVTITGLTKQQVALLDKMWAIDGYDEYMEWKSTLPRRTLRMVSVLEEMVLLAELDEIDDVSDAQEVLRKYI